MIVISVAVDGFKNLEDVLITPHSQYNLITGMNAQGKTNLIESVWLMTGCKSFRGSRERDYIGIGKQKMQIDLSFDDGRRIQNIDYSINRESIKDKKLSLNGVAVKGTGKLFENFKCIVFTPDDIDIIRGGPEKRRSFIDLCSCQLKYRSLGMIKCYDMLLSQRNALLKSLSYGQASADSLSVWDRQIAEVGTEVSRQRYMYIKQLNTVCSELYSRITCKRESFSLEYNSNVFGAELEKENTDEYYAEQYYHKLSGSQEEDIRLGYSLRGAHRDDVSIKINGMNIRDYGSQGQKKTAALVLKLGQAEIYYKNRDEAPVILLDDVMGELDESRQKLVFEVVNGMQVFITACNENAVSGLGVGKHFVVENGHVKNGV